MTRMGGNTSGGTRVIRMTPSAGRYVCRFATPALVPRMLRAVFLRLCVLRLCVLRLCVLRRIGFRRGSRGSCGLRRGVGGVRLTVVIPVIPVIIPVIPVIIPVIVTVIVTVIIPVVVTVIIPVVVTVIVTVIIPVIIPVVPVVRVRRRRCFMPGMPRHRTRITRPILMILTARRQMLERIGSRNHTIVDART